MSYVPPQNTGSTTPNQTPAPQIQSQEAQQHATAITSPSDTVAEREETQEIKQVQQPASQLRPQNNYPFATPLASLQQSSVPIDCPICHMRELTTVEYVAGTTTHLYAALLCFCFCLGCLPYLATWSKDVEHKCGHCGALVAIWHRGGKTEVVDVDEPEVPEPKEAKSKEADAKAVESTASKDPETAEPKSHWWKRWA